MRLLAQDHTGNYKETLDALELWKSTVTVPDCAMRRRLNKAKCWLGVDGEKSKFLIDTGFLIDLFISIGLNFHDQLGVAHK